MTRQFADTNLDFGAYEELYKDLHKNPGLSLQETYASTKVIEHLSHLNEKLLSASNTKVTIHERIGGFGVAACFHNGDGPTVLLRADMDALPVQEKTGLSYASTKRDIDVADGIEKPVMHACGHDMHVTCLLAAAEVLIHQSKDWSGTLVFVFQPNEERAAGAKAMVDDGLYSKVLVPDLVLGQHVMPGRSGNLMVRTGTMMAAADSFRITLFGRGGHGSMPNNCIDTVLLAANVVTRLHQIVAREVDPNEAVVLSVGSLQAGETENVIPEHAKILVNVRSQNPRSRHRVLRSMERIIKAECQASGCTKDPVIEETTRFPLTVNDADVTAKVKEAFTNSFGGRLVADGAGVNASEDVSYLATSVGKPCCYWFFFGTDAGKYDDAAKNDRITEDIPVNHSGYFAPVVQPTMRTGVEALVTAALAFLSK